MYQLPFIIKTSVDKFWFLISFELRNIKLFARCGNLIDWKIQNLRFHVVFVEFLTHLSPELPDFFHQGLNGQLYLCIRLLVEHIPKFFLCICILIGCEIEKTPTCWGFSFKSKFFSSKELAGFPFSSSYKMVLNFQKMTQKIVPGLILCFGALIGR